MLGEDHLTHEIPQFAAALCDIMHPDAYAVEAGPSAAHFVNGLLETPNRLEMMAVRSNYLAQNLSPESRRIARFQSRPRRTSQTAFPCPLHYLQAPKSGPTHILQTRR
jgi:hypothetical protein